MGYREDLDINVNNLDEEWLNHGQKFMDYVELAAQAEFDKNTANQNRTNVRAEVAKKIRSRPKKYGLDKLPATVKETHVKNLVDLHPKVKKADMEFFKATRNERILSKAEHAMGTYRRSVLEKVTERIEKGLFAEPRYISRGVSPNVKHQERREGVRMRKSLKRKLKERS